MKFGTNYARHQKRKLAYSKARAARLGDAYRVSNKLQMRRNRRKRLDRGQAFLPLDIPQNSPAAPGATPQPANDCIPVETPPPPKRKRVKVRIAK